MTMYMYGNTSRLALIIHQAGTDFAILLPDCERPDLSRYATKEYVNQLFEEFSSGKAAIADAIGDPANPSMSLSELAALIKRGE